MGGTITTERAVERAVHGSGGRLQPRVGLALLALLVAACTGARLPRGATADAEYHVFPPDSLQITIRPEPAIQRTVVVRPDGNISLDLVGDVYARGKTVEQLRSEIEARLREFIRNPDVTVVLEQSASRVFFVFGEVNRTGRFPLIGDVDALEALGTAGGPTRFASMNGSRLVRPGAEGSRVFEVRFGDIAYQGVPDTNYVLQDGDVIYVPPNLAARIGFGLQIVFFPLQQIFGLGGSAARTVFLP
jgi:polysaccharide export outer membrane protein